MNIAHAQHTAGELAYFDSFAGLIPCKVVSVNDAADSEFLGLSITVKLTADRGSYRRGEVIESDALHVIPRGYVRGLRSRSSTPRILSGYRWTA